jgi:hypothetical protein
MAEGRATYEIKVDARGAQQTLDGVVKSAQPKFEKLAGTINAVTSMTGGLGGAVGKAAGALSQMGGLFLAGGPVGIGLAAGVAIFGSLAGKMREAEEQSAALAKSLSEAQRQSVDDIAASYGDLSRELAALAGRSADYRLEVARLAKTQAEAHAAETERMQSSAGAAFMRARGDRGVIGSIMDIKSDEEIEAEKAWTQATIAATGARTQLAKATNELTAAEAARWVATERGSPSKPGGGGSSRRGATVGGGIIGQIDIEAEQDAAIAARRLKAESDALDEMIAITEANEAQRLAAMESVRRMDVADYEATELEKRDIASESHEHFMSLAGEYADFAQSSISSVFSTYLDVVEQAAAGQEIAFEQLAAAFIRNMGTQIFGIGLKSVFEGSAAIASGVVNGNPAAITGGIKLLAVGGAAMAAGGAMATTGAIAQGRFSASAGSGGGSSSSSASTSRTSSRGRDSGVPDDSQNVSMVIIGGTFLGDPSDGARRFEQNRRRQLRNVHVAGMA